MHSPTNEGPSTQDTPANGELHSRLANLTAAQKEVLRKKLAQRNQAQQNQSQAEQDPTSPRVADDAIAIVGMGCRFPGAADLDEYWNLIESGTEAVDTVPDDRWDRARFYDPTGRSPGKMSVDRMGSVAGVDQFDPAFFGIAPREASRMDPQQRLLLEIAWETFENAGIAMDKMAGSNTGVYVGIGGTDYSKVPAQFPNYFETIDAHIGTGNALSIAAARISYLFDFRGPSFIVDTACSSALVAIHNAVVSLRRNECDAALAGGVNLILSPETTIAFSKARMLSPDGHCRPFDDAAAGYVRGEGCGLVLLKRYQDAVDAGDDILGLVRASAINQDGRTSGITAPNSGSQVRVIRSALDQAGLTVDDISYVEAHGTGTPLGDPIEMTALSDVFASRSKDTDPVRIGSVKANIGHTETASGIAGLLKVLQMFARETIPAQANFTKLNSNVALAPGVLEVAQETRPWQDNGAPRRAGVSSFGFGGTNAHLIIESPPLAAEDKQKTPSIAPEFALPLSAADPSAIADLADRYQNRIAGLSAGDVDDVCYAAATRRSELPLRAVALAANSESLSASLATLADLDQQDRWLSGRKPAGRRTRIAMLFTGQGSQYVDMGRSLLETLPVFQQAIQRCEAILAPLMPIKLTDALEGKFGERPELSIDHTSIAQPVICAVQCALVDSLKAVGIKPGVVAGHSIGEIAAMYAMGALSLEDTLRLAAIRGKVMGELPAGGSMAAILTSAESVQSWLDESRSTAVIATVNGPSAVVIAGDDDAVDRMITISEANNVGTRRLSVSHAFHSPHMQPACATLRSELESFLPEARIPTTATFFSSVTGERLTGKVDVDYWVDHVVRPVRFDAVIERLDEAKIDLAIEVGPSPHLTAMIRRARIESPDTDSFHVEPTLNPKGGDYGHWIRAVSHAWCVGKSVDWRAIADQFPRQRNRIGLPNYPFQRSRYWLEPESVGTNATSRTMVHPILGDEQTLADGTVLHNAVLRSTDPNFIADHVVSGSVIVPGAAWIETIRAAASRRFENGFELRNVEIKQPLFLDADQATRVQTRVTGGTYKAKIEIAFQSDSDEAIWQTLATADAFASVQVDESAGFSLSEPTSGKPVTGEDLYEQLAARQLEYGEFFRVVQNVVADENSASGTLTLEPALHNEASQYVFHPALLDGCFHLFAAGDVGAKADGRTFLPVGVQRVVVGEAAASTTITARVRRRTIEANEFLADVELVNDAGRLIGRLEGVRMQSLQRQTTHQESDPMSWVHDVEWTPIEVPTGDIETAIEPSCCVWTSREFTMDGAEDLAMQTERACQSLLAKIQNAIASPSAQPLRVVVARAHQISGNDHVEPVSTALVAMCRVAANEHPALDLRVLDIAAWDDATEDVIANGLSILDRAGEDAESELAYRDSRWYRPRLIHTASGMGREVGSLSSSDAEVVIPRHGHFRVRLDGTDRIEGLWTQRITPPSTQPDEVAIRIRAVGMNFSDVLKAMGLYPGLRADEVTPTGIEACGTITRVGNDVDGLAVGDRVMGIVPYGFATDDATKDHLLVKVPDGISDEESASIPIAFLTAHHALASVGRLRAGETVLIHAAAGGVGLAAIQVAQSLSATIYATAGNATKRALIAELGVPTENIFDSRDIASIDKIRLHTGGRGVDVVLNSLPGDWMEASLGLVAAHGRFLEIGKTDIYQDHKVGLSPFQDNLTYSAIDLDRLLREKPAYVRELFAEVVTRFEEKTYRPTVINSFALERLPEAMRFMAARRNVGKIVVSPPRMNPDVVSESGAYLITGGSGSIARGLARRLIQRGAREVALVARREASDAVIELQRWAREHDATCHYLQADCTDESSLRSAIQSAVAESGLCIVGIIHAAGLLDDGLIHEMDPARLTRVMKPKVTGTAILDRVTADHPVRQFVMIGSIASVFGSPGQANYAAANAFMEGFAARRRHLGKPATVVHFGPWDSDPLAVGEGGMAENETRRRNLDSRGLTPLDFVASLDLLIDSFAESQTTSQVVVDANFSRMLASTRPSDLPSLLRGLATDVTDSSSSSTSVKDVAYIDQLRTMESSERCDSLSGYFAIQLGLILSMAPETIDPAESLSAFGLDSLMAIELKNTIEAKLDITLPISKFMNEPSLASLAAAAAELMVD